MTSRIQGLYAITDPALTPDALLLPAAEAALHGGARLLQYRDKTASADQRRRRASQLRALCHQYDAGFIVNDDPALAADVQADGVHIGQSDADIALARQLLGPDRIIGVTCHSDLALARSHRRRRRLCSPRPLLASRTKPWRRRPRCPPQSLVRLSCARGGHRWIMRNAAD